MATPAAASQPATPAWWSRLFTFPVAALSLIVPVIFVSGVRSIAEPDIWWHLKNAEHMVRTFSFPSFDTYSFTASGAPWMDHSWLAELFFYGAFQAGGLSGVLCLYLAICIVIFAGLYRLTLAHEANPKTAAVLMMLGILVASVSFGPRMLLFGWLAMIALLSILHRFATTRRGPLWVLPLVFCAWINFHGSWLFGLVVLGIFLVSGLMQGSWGSVDAKRFTLQEWKRLSLVSGLCVAALFVNPFGYKLVGYPLDLMFRQRINLTNIDEWRSVNFHETGGMLVLALLLSLLASALVSKRRWTLYEALLAMFAVYASLTYWRMQFLAALVFLPLAASRVPLFPAYDPQKEKPLLNAAIMVGAVLFVVLRFPSEAELQQRVHTQFPQAALAYMTENGMTERVYNNYLWGGYIIWHAPQIKTFIDGRADLFVYGGVFQDYLNVDRVIASFETLERYRIQSALVPVDGRVAYLLARDPCWREVYTDDVAAVFKLEAEASTQCVRAGVRAGREELPK